MATHREYDTGKFAGQHRDRSGFGFAEIVEKGENPLGFVSQTPNGTTRDCTGPDVPWDAFNGAERTMVPPVTGGSCTPSELEKPNENVSFIAVATSKK